MKASNTIVWTCGVFNIVDDEFWFVPYEQNLLCRYSMREKAVVEVFPLEVSPFQVESFDHVYRMNDKVFMIPAFEKYLHVFDVNQRNSQLVTIPEFTGVGERFLLCHQYGEWLYLFPSFFDKIIKVHVNTLIIEEVCMKEAGRCNAFCDIAVKGSKAYLVNGKNRIYLFDFELDQLSTVCQFADISELRTVSFWNDELMVSDQKGCVWAYDLIEKKETLFAEYGIAFVGTYCVDSSLFLIPLLEKDFFLRVNLEDRCLQKIELCKKDHYKKWPHRVFSRASIYKDCLFFFSTQYRTLIKYNCLTGELEESSIAIEPASITQDTLHDWLRRETEAGNSLIEGNGPYTSLDNLIEYCINS